MEITSTENVNVIQAGKEKTVVCDMMNARWQIVVVTVNAQMGSAFASVDSKENSAKKVCSNNI